MCTKVDREVRLSDAVRGVITSLGVILTNPTMWPAEHRMHMSCPVVSVAESVRYCTCTSQGRIPRMPSALQLVHSA